MKHILLRNSRLKGWEFGVLRALEEAIIKQTGAEVVEVPDYGLQPLMKRSGHGMRFEVARKFLPKKNLHIDADVLWYILMCPENYEMDLFTGWEQVPKRIIYIFDTLNAHFPFIKNLFSGHAFNVLITSFHDAVNDLVQLTGNQWHAVEQAIPNEAFYLIDQKEKIIHFSSYGRRLHRFHEHLLEFCIQNNLYYDYSTHNSSNVWTHEVELYRQYAWHVQHSMFTVSWPVEITNPQKAGSFNPLTCRWFEAAASGTVIIGKQPANPLFNELLCPDLVTEIDPFAEKKQLWKQLELIYTERNQLLNKAYRIAAGNKDRWIWTNRVERILALIA